MIYLSLGSNEGNRLSYLKKAIQLLKKIGFSVIEESIVLETPAMLKPNAPEAWNKPYLNLVIRGTTTLPPHTFLQKLHQIEQTLGRPDSHETWAPRTIDLDILLWNQEVIDTPTLKIPHPALLDRFFWLHLLAMLAPDLCLPNQPNETLGALAHRMLPTQPFFIRSLVLTPQLVGIVNITPDSFSDGGAYLHPEPAIQHILKLHQEGAAVIDIGAQSTRPGAAFISPHEEYQRLEPILDGIKPHIQSKGIQLSLDSYHPTTLLKALKHYPIAWVNLQTLPPPEVLSEIATHSCHIVPMHSLTLPPTKEHIITHLTEIERWTESTLIQLKACGFTDSRIILDPGIGFGKSVYQNLQLLQGIKRLQTFHFPILIGHSRKSYMRAFSHKKPNERDIETLAISDNLLASGVDYLRVHEIAAHHQFWTAKQSTKPL